MSQQNLYLTSKITPPRIKAESLYREKVDRLFQKMTDFPVTLIFSEAGYGKTTSLANHVVSKFEFVSWYTIESSERDISYFLRYLILSLKKIDSSIGDRSLRLLDEVESVTTVLEHCVYLLINDLAECACKPMIVILDDFHTVIGVSEIAVALEIIIRYLPNHVHLVISGREIPDFPILKRLKTRFDILFIGKNELAFSQSDIEELFHKTYGIPIESKQIEYLHQQTEGWIIALQMVCKGMEKGLQVTEVWENSQNENLNQLFDLLAEEVFLRQSKEIQEFLSKVCILETMEPQICDQLFQYKGSDKMFRDLEKQGLFIIDQGGGQYRFHRLFHKFLNKRLETMLDAKQLNILFSKAADYYLDKDLDQSLQYYLKSEELDKIAKVLSQLGDRLLKEGRFELLKKWIDSLPPDIRTDQPKLFFLRGEIERIGTRFHDAEQWYLLAEKVYIQKRDVFGQSMVYQGLAQMYLDSVQPNQANSWLDKAAYVLADAYPHQKSVILRQLAENYVNGGHPFDAEKVLHQADELEPRAMPDELDIRIQMRKGNVTAAQKLTLEILHGIDQQRIHRFHREADLLLSILYALSGESMSSEYHANQAIRLGKELKSAFVEMIGYARLGHAYLLQDRLQDALKAYDTSIDISRELNFERGKLEAIIGLASVHALLGNVAQGEQYGKIALEMAIQINDFWLMNLVRSSLAVINLSVQRYKEALKWLLIAQDGFMKCGDTFSLAKVHMVLCIVYFHTGQEALCHESMTFLLQQVEKNNEFQNLFVKKTLFGPLDNQEIVPCLIDARDRYKNPVAERILTIMGYKHVKRHPGYTLRIFTLGKFVLYKGSIELSKRDWRREKSLQLFHLLLVHAGKFIQKEEICDMLWPDIDQDAALRDFKVALSVLTSVIESKKETRSESFFIERSQSSYRLLMNQAVWIDAREFEKLARLGLRQVEEEHRQKKDNGISDTTIQILETATKLYGGDFLSEFSFAEWCLNERERLRNLYIRVVENLARIYLQKQLLQKTIEYCEKILELDPCFEEAYRILLHCYHQLGNRSFIISTYKKCKENLQELLGLPPSYEINELYAKYL